MTSIPSMRHLDHIVVAVRDLGRAADEYRRLGFQVGARNRHPWGTENRLIQFGSSFIELITVSADAAAIPPHQPHRFSFGAFVRDYLAEREGLAMLVLSSEDAASDAVRFAQSGIGDFEPFHFARTGRAPDGAETHVAFTLAFAADPLAPRAGFFVCQQHFPEHFWNRRFQQHANAATNLTAVTLTAADPRAHTAFLSRFCGTEPRTEGDDTWTFPLDGGRMLLASASWPSPSPSPSPSPPPPAPTQTQAGQRLSAPALLTTVMIEVADTDTVARLLEAAQIPFTVARRRVVVAPAHLFGVELQFELSASRSQE